MAVRAFFFSVSWVHAQALREYQDDLEYEPIVSSQYETAREVIDQRIESLRERIRNCKETQRYKGVSKKRAVQHCQEEAQKSLYLIKQQQVQSNQAAVDFGRRYLAQHKKDFKGREARAQQRKISKLLSQLEKHSNKYLHCAKRTYTTFSCNRMYEYIIRDTDELRTIWDNIQLKKALHP